ncbi:MAG: hypothetical protein J0I06_08120 [Planctomycetes bacterium]|nr:hypothetical protein [Planctomycetota bacterium]
MSPLEILSHVRHTPFEPFRLILLDGAKYDIRRADQCMVMKREVVIGVPDRAGELIEYMLKFHYHVVVRVEPLPVPETPAASA